MQAELAGEFSQVIEQLMQQQAMRNRIASRRAATFSAGRRIGTVCGI
jgi:hypothetical protein